MVEDQRIGTRSSPSHNVTKDNEIGNCWTRLRDCHPLTPNTGVRDKGGTRKPLLVCIAFGASLCTESQRQLSGLKSFASVVSHGNPCFILKNLIKLLPLMGGRG